MKRVWVFEIYKKQTLGLAPRWYWRLKAGNGKTVADGAEKYYSKANAERAVRSLIDNMSVSAFVIKEV